MVLLNVLACAVAGILAIRHGLASPFGYALRAGRDSPLRAEAIGINVRAQQWAAFALSGGFAGLAGAIAVPGGNGRINSRQKGEDKRYITDVS